MVNQSLRAQPVLVEKYITAGTETATLTGISVPAGTYVIAAGAEALDVIPDITTYTVTLTDGTTTFANALNFDNKAAGTILVGATAGLIPSADTIDATVTISGTVTAKRFRIFALVVPVTKNTLPGALATRDFLA